MISRRLVLLALGVTALALAVRLPFLGADLFHTDSVFQARAVEGWVLDGRFTYMHRPGYPGQVLLAAPVFWLHHTLTGATSAAFAVTLQSALAGSLAAGLMVIFARPHLRGDWGAASAGLFTAAMPTFLSTTTFAMSHGSQVALLLGAGIAAGHASRRGTLLCGLFAGLAVATRTESVFFVPALLAIHWRDESPIGFDREQGFQLRVPAAALARDLALIAVPLVLVPLALYAKQFGDVGLAEWREASADTGWLGPVSSALPLGLAAAERNWGWFGLLIAAVGLIVLWRRQRSSAVIVLLWTLVPFVFLANTLIVVPRHLISALVVLAIPLATCVETIRHRAAAVGLTAILAGALVAGVIPTLRTRSARCGPADHARAVAQAVPPGASVMAMDLIPHLEYFGRIATLERAALDGGAEDSSRIEAAFAAIRERLAVGAEVFIVSDGFAYDRPDPESGIVKVQIGGEAGGQEALGHFGLALIQEFELRHVLTTPYEDWHGAALGPRPGAPTVAHLYRVLP